MRLNSFLIPLSDLRDISNVEVSGGFVSLASPFDVSVCFSFEYLSAKKICEKLSSSRAWLFYNGTFEQSLSKVFDLLQSTSQD